MLFAHLKRILGLGRLRLRGPNGARDEFLLAATAQNLRKLAKLVPLPAPAFADRGAAAELYLTDNRRERLSSLSQIGFVNKIGRLKPFVRAQSNVRRGFLCNPRLIVRRFLIEA